jgi:hypothetical protein
MSQEPFSILLMPEKQSVFKNTDSEILFICRAEYPRSSFPILWSMGLLTSLGLVYWFGERSDGCCFVLAEKERKTQNVKKIANDCRR